jgi:hypothetical protein
MPLNASAPSTDKYAQELLLSRTILKNEMIRATKAITLEDKRNLLSVWKSVYKPEIVDELLRVAKDQAARHRIANWNLANFEGDRIGKSISSSSNNNVKPKRVKENYTKYK